MLFVRKARARPKASRLSRMALSRVAGTPFPSLLLCAAIVLSMPSTDAIPHLLQVSSALESESSSPRSLSSTAFLASLRSSLDDASVRCSTRAPTSLLSSAALPYDAPRRSPETRRAGASESEKTQSCLRACGELSSMSTPIIPRILRNSRSLLARFFATLTRLLMSATQEYPPVSSALRSARPR